MEFLQGSAAILRALPSHALRIEGLIGAPLEARRIANSKIR
jgi:hypothetical protein